MPSPDRVMHPCFLPPNFLLRLAEEQKEDELRRARYRAHPVRDQYCDEPSPEDVEQHLAGDFSQLSDSDE